MPADGTLAFERRRPLSGVVNKSRARRPRDRAESVFRQRITPAWRHVDVMLPLAALGLSVLGILMILAATRGTDPGSYDFGFVRRQMIYTAIGVVLMVVVASVDYRRFRRWSWLPYVIALVLLVMVSLAGSAARGSQRWFEIGNFQLQPAEFAKVAVIMAVAALLAQRQSPLRARWLFVGLTVIGGPLLLVGSQPDLGTSLAFGAIALGVLLVAGTRTRHLVILTSCVLLLGLGVLNSDVLEDYQRERLTSFLDQESTLSQESYNLDQSRIALASGGPFGKGLFEGTQTRLGNVPEQHTDFIFAAVGEDLGFAGTATVLGLFGVLAWRIWRAATMSQDRFGMMLSVGVLSMLVFQVFQNIGMTIGLMPITGLPLPFLSYGGSSVIASWAAIGLVLNVHMRRYR